MGSNGNHRYLAIPCNYHVRLDVVIDLGDGTMLALYVSFLSSANRCIKRVISEHLERPERLQWHNHDFAKTSCPPHPATHSDFKLHAGRNG